MLFRKLNKDSNWINNVWISDKAHLYSDNRKFSEFENMDEGKTICNEWETTSKPEVNGMVRDECHGIIEPLWIEESSHAVGSKGIDKQLMIFMKFWNILVVWKSRRISGWCKTGSSPHSKCNNVSCGRNIWWPLNIREGQFCNSEAIPERS